MYHNATEQLYKQKN